MPPNLWQAGEELTLIIDHNLGNFGVNIAGEFKGWAFEDLDMIKT